MSGHSKWASIKHKQGAADAKRAQAFTKLANMITVAAREGGGDMDSNFSLRLAVDKAKGANMPKDRIARAIARGTGEGSEAGALETAVYEGMGPGGAALLVEALTDNRNRTIANIKGIFNRRGGNLEAKVKWMFERKGVVHTSLPQLWGSQEGADEKDAFELALIEAGAEEISRDENRISVISAISDLQNVEKAVRSAGLAIEGAGLEYVAKQETKISKEDENKLAGFIEALEEDDDVSAVYTNAA